MDQLESVKAFALENPVVATVAGAIVCFLLLMVVTGQTTKSKLKSEPEAKGTVSKYNSRYYCFYGLCCTSTKQPGAGCSAPLRPPSLVLITIFIFWFLGKKKEKKNEEKGKKEEREKNHTTFISCLHYIMR